MVNQELVEFDLVIVSRDTKRLAISLDLINQSSILPKSVIWCLPPDFLVINQYFGTSRYAFDVSLVKSSQKGQVHQRVFGICQATTEYVIFMDDDIQFGNSLFARLLQHVVMYDHCAVAPLIFNSNQTQLYRRPSKIKKVVDLIFHGFPYNSERSGKIGLSGFPKYVDPEELRSPAFEVEWLPGGVQIIKKSLFPTNSYYPYEGKAYCEDLYLSEIYRKNFLKMFILPVNVYTEVVPLRLDFKSLYFDYRARLNFVLGTNRSIIRMTLWYLCLLIGGSLGV